MTSTDTSHGPIEGPPTSPSRNDTRQVSNGRSDQLGNVNVGAKGSSEGHPHSPGHRHSHPHIDHARCGVSHPSSPPKRQKHETSDLLYARREDRLGARVELTAKLRVNLGMAKALEDHGTVDKKNRITSDFDLGNLNFPESSLYDWFELQFPGSLHPRIGIIISNCIKRRWYAVSESMNQGIGEGTRDDIEEKSAENCRKR